MQDIFQGKDAKKTAIIHGGKSISYGALRALTKEYTDYFQAHGLQAGDVVLFVMPLSIRFYAALIALISMGARAFILDSLAQGRFSQAINKGGARHLLVEILGKPRVIPLFSRSERPNSRKSKLETKGSLMTFTSGTTSLKIIERSADFLQAQAKILDDSLKLAESKVILTTLPVFVLAHLYYGVTTILSDKNTVDLRQILKEKPDKIIAAPHYLGLLTEVVSKAKVALPALKEILVGGAPVFPRLAGKVLETLPDVAFTAVYGSSEAEPIAHLHITKESLHLVSEIACAGGGLCQGRPLCSTFVVAKEKLQEFARRDGDGNCFSREELETILCAPGEKGEIIVAGPHVVETYLNGAGNRGSKFVFDGVTYHATGDAGYFDSEGLLYLCGRAGYQSQIEEGRYPLEVEARALSFAGVTMSAYLEEKGQPYLFVTSEKLVSPDLLEYARKHNMRLRLRKRLPLDRRHNSKVLYEELRLSI